MPITKPDKEKLIRKIRKELLLLENSKEIRFVAGIVFKINIRRSVRSQLEKNNNEDKFFCRRNK